MTSVLYNQSSINNIYAKILMVFNNEVDIETINKYTLDIIHKSNKYDIDIDDVYTEEHYRFIDDD